MNREYEIGFILNPESSDEEVKKVTDSIEDILKKGKATIENVDDWGRKKLAYPIEKHVEGIYIFYKTMAPGDIIMSIERRLKLSENVMRFIVLRLDDKLKKTNRLEKKWKRIDKFIKKREEEREAAEAKTEKVQSEKEEVTDEKTE